MLNLGCADTLRPKLNRTIVGLACLRTSLYSQLAREMHLVDDPFYLLRLIISVAVRLLVGRRDVLPRKAPLHSAT